MSRSISKDNILKNEILVVREIFPVRIFFIDRR
jgi:hypothetical protein